MKKFLCIIVCLIWSATPLLASDYEYVMPEEATVVDADVLTKVATAAKSAAGDADSYSATIRLRAGVAYTIGSTNVTIPDGLSVFFVGDEANRPELSFTKQFFVTGTHDNISFENLNIKDGGQGYIINQNAACAVGSILFKGCTIDGFSRSIVRFQSNDTEKNVGTINVEDCTVCNQGSGGYSTFYMQQIKGSMGKVDIKNSTFYNLQHSFIDYGTKTSDINSVEVSITDCTFYNCIGNGYYLVNAKTKTLYLEQWRNIFGMTYNQHARGIQAETLYQNGGGSYATSDFTQESFDNLYYSWLGVSSSSFFKDPTNGDFTQSTLTDAGALEWRPVMENVNIGGVHYLINKTGMHVTVLPYNTDNLYTGDIVIPATINSDDIDYPVTTIDREAFKDCIGLTSVVLGDNIDEIGALAFDGCTAMKSITFGPKAVTMDAGVFGDCTALEKVVVPNIASWCSMSFPDFVESTEIVKRSNPLYYAHHLYSDADMEITELVIPDGVEWIGYNAFLGCSSLTSVVIGDNVRSIGQNAFLGCTALEKVTVKNLAKWVAIIDFQVLHSEQRDYVNNPLYYAHHLYDASGSEVTELVFPDGVTSIGNYAFAYATGLKSVTLPASVETIGARAFYNAEQLATVDFGNSETSVGSQAFENTAWMNGQPDGIIYIGNSVYTCKGTLPENTSLMIKDGTTTISSQAFSNQTGLTEITIPSSVKSIGSAAFTVTGLKQVAIPNTVEEIGEKVFYSCHSLEQVILPETMQSIPYGTFWNCSALKDCVIPSTVSIIDEYAFRGAGLTDINIPASVTSIGRGAFMECKGVTTLKLPEGLKTIAVNAFRECTSLKTVFLPSTLEVSIGNGAFRDCTSLEAVYSYITNPQEVDPGTAFINVNISSETSSYESTFTTATLYVPTGTKTAYQAAKGWKNFSNIVEFDPNSPTGISEMIYRNGENRTGTDKVYDLQGRRVTNPSKGCYIVNGRKVVLK